MKKTIFMSIIVLITASTQAIRASLVPIKNVEDFFNVVQSNTPTLVIFSSERCSACQLLKAPLQKVIDNPEFKNVAFIILDVDQQEALAQEYHIRKMPTLLFIQANMKKNEIIGVPAQPEQTLSAAIRTAFGMTAPEGITAPIINQETIAETDIIQEAPAQTESPAQAPANFFTALMNAFATIFNYLKHMIMTGIEKLQDVFSSK
jgi:thioredoxin-like negative regulator of GroEL